MDISERRYKLPNKLLIYHVNKHETDFVYNEIFEERIYLKHGISISKDSVVFDIGANIGLFSLFINQEFSDSAIYSFEPSRQFFELLHLNVAQQ